MRARARAAGWTPRRRGQSQCWRGKSANRLPWLLPRPRHNAAACHPDTCFALAVYQRAHLHCRTTVTSAPPPRAREAQRTRVAAPGLVQARVQAGATGRAASSRAGKPRVAMSHTTCFAPSLAAAAERRAARGARSSSLQPARCVCCAAGATACGGAGRQRLGLTHCGPSAPATQVAKGAGQPGGAGAAASARAVRPRAAHAAASLFRRLPG